MALKNSPPNIDYKYWSQRKPFYSDVKIRETTETCLKRFASRGGLIDDLVAKVDALTYRGLVSAIESEIVSCTAKKDYTACRVLRIFDMIQAWGGKGGRHVYIQPKRSPSRFSDQTSLVSAYSDGIKAIEKNDISLGLQSFQTIRGLGLSFATKHMFFWGKYGQAKVELPIYDRRIQLLLYPSTSTIPKYEEYLVDLQHIGNINGIGIEEVESALFAFSENWFQTSKLVLKSAKEQDQQDEAEAIRIHEFYSNINCKKGIITYT